MNIGELTEFAAEQQRQFDAATSPEERKSRGHFGTPRAIAEFMAGMFSEFRGPDIRVLDAGAGVGTLSAAICQRALASKRCYRLSFELWENDPALVPLLERTMKGCRRALLAAGHDLKFVVRVDDFVLANSKRTLFDDGPAGAFDLAILNPPYFKLRKESPQAQAMDHVVHGQPNIYALFMAVVADMLVPGGEMIAITPRSYFNGPYFKRFRKWFFDRVVARRIHVFESRSDAFKEDAVLQENVILHAVRSREKREITVTTSAGRNLSTVVTTSTSYERTIDDSNGDHVVRIVSNPFEHDVMAAVDSFPCRFGEMGFEISTGPVVTFRSTEHLRHERGRHTAPLLWMHNVRPFVTQFPPKNGKPTHIEISDASRRLLVPSKTYVLLKRFTAKEEKRRLVAGIVNADDSYSDWLGLENHLNYVYRRRSELSRTEAFGLAAYFNSALVDRFFRAVSGNTQVNAAEIRAMPIPDEATIERIGKEIERIESRDALTVEQVVGQAIGLPKTLLARLIEVST